METGRQNRTELLDGKIGLLEERLIESNETSTKKIEQMKDQVY